MPMTVDTGNLTHLNVISATQLSDGNNGTVGLSLPALTSVPHFFPSHGLQCCQKQDCAQLKDRTTEFLVSWVGLHGQVLTNEIGTGRMF